MNLPTRSCYVKVQGREAVKITSLKVKQPTVDQKELVAVLGEYKSRYQRSQQEAEDVLKREEHRKNFYGDVPIHEESADTVFDSRNQFHNPFATAASKDKEKQVR